MSGGAHERRVAALFETVVELPAAERDRVLAARCAGDSALRRAVETLLAAFDGGSTGDVLRPLPPPGADAIGEAVGPYRILGPLGEGGMGVVYHAERADVGLRVALKLVRHGRFASAEQVDRFYRERRILARLEHPGIARLIDAGVTDHGLPFLAMELVDGVPIDRYCDTAAMPIEARVDLFLQVCDAVDYAHRHLVIHRDLKPSNILVGPDGRVRLLDFGIAKLVGADDEPDHTLTRAGAAPMTPAYASPEQVQGRPVGTAADVYSLGVVLYELLCGQRPYALAGRSAAEIERTVCVTEPPHPSAAARATPAALQDVLRNRATDAERLHRSLAGDLDAITLKALAKEPDQRYASVRELADDLGNWRAALPVRARPAGGAYRARKFVRRNRRAVAAAAAVAASLILGGGAALWNAREARVHRDIALHGANAMVFELAEGLSRMTGPTEARLGLLTRAAAAFEAIGVAGRRTREHRHQMADVYRVLAQTYRLLGDVPRAHHFIARAEQLARQLAAERGADPLVLAHVLVEFGDVLAAAGNADSALLVFSEASALVAAVPHTDDVRLDRLRYFAHSRLADALWEHAGHADSAASLYRVAATAAQQLAHTDSSNAQYRAFHASSQERLADVAYYGGQESESCAGYRAALETRRLANRLAPDDAMILRNYAVSLQNVAWCEEHEGDADAALRGYGQANELLRRLHRDDPDNVMVLTLLIGGVAETATTLSGLGRLDAALAAYEDAAALGEAFHARGLTDARVTWKTAQVLQLLADAHISAGQRAAATAVLTRARTLLEQRLAHAADNVELMRSLAAVVQSEARLQSAAGDATGAEHTLHAALALHRSIAERTGLAQDEVRIARAQQQLAATLRELGRLADARNALRAAERLLLGLRADGRLDDAAEATRRDLAAIQAALSELER